MISCALGICCESVNELMVGTMMSRFPFTTSVGWAILLSSPKRSPRTSLHSAIAASCAFIACAELGGSMSFVRRCRRSQKALPAPWLLADGAKNKRSEEHTSELQSLAYLVCRLLLEKKKKKN